MTLELILILYFLCLQISVCWSNNYESDNRDVVEAARICYYMQSNAHLIIFMIICQLKGLESCNFTKNNIMSLMYETN